MKSQNPEDQMSGQAQTQDVSTSVRNPSPSPGHVRLVRVVRECMGWSPALQSGLGALDDDTAKALAYMIEQLQAQAARSASSGFRRGFAAGQQLQKSRCWANHDGSPIGRTVMEADARRILEVFRRRGLRAGGFISLTDFDDAIVWENGYVRDESVRQGMAHLIEEGFVLEMCAGLRLTEKGEDSLSETWA